jgi:hypothetical protein
MVANEFRRAAFVVLSRARFHSFLPRAIFYRGFCQLKRIVKPIQDRDLEVAYVCRSDLAGPRISMGTKIVSRKSIVSANASNVSACLKLACRTSV